MSRIGSSSSNSPEMSTGPAESEPGAAPPRRESSSAGTQVEPWVGHRPLNFSGPEFRAAADLASRSGPDLAAQAAKETADRIAAMKVIAELGAPLSKLAATHPDPLGKNRFGSNEVASGSFGDALHQPAFTRAVSQLSPSDVRVALQEQVRLAWPRRSPEEVVHIRKYLMGEISMVLRETTAPRLQDLATKMLSETAKSFDKTAHDPKEVAALATRLNAMADPLADPEDQATVRDLRAGFGLAIDEANVTPEKLGKALEERAALLREEATKMKNHSRPSLFRALAEQDVGPGFKQAAGIREGSLLAAQIEAVKTEGEAEAHTIGNVKFVCMLTAAAASGGMGLGLIGTGVSAAMAAPSLVHAWEGVGTAKAGESAGTMKVGAGEEANRKAIIETAGAVLSVAGSAAISHGLHHGVEKVAQSVADGYLVHAAAHMAIEGAVEKTVEPLGEGLGEALTAEGDARGKNAFERLSRD